jgi:hypothetical protein
VCSLQQETRTEPQQRKAHLLCDWATFLGRQQARQTASETGTLGLHDVLCSGLAQVTAARQNMHSLVGVAQNSSLQTVQLQESKCHPPFAAEA